MDQEVNRGSYFMKRITLGMVGVLVALSQAGTDAQGAKPPQLATDITAAEVQAVIKAPTGGGDRQMKVVDMGKYNVSVGVLRRAATKPGAPVGAINHEHVTEVYYIISGSGTLLTGGTVEGAKPLPADGEIVKIAVGPSNQGTFKQAAQSRKVGPGDIVIIPPACITALPMSTITSSTCRSGQIPITCCRPDTCIRC
jgi:quercetin dioxygenase-like cupin family protein